MNGNNIYLPPTPVTPGTLLVVSITNSNPMLVTFTNSIENTYFVGMNIYFVIPQNYGMQQLNDKFAQIIGINSNVFTVNIDSTNFDPFMVPSNPIQVAQIAPYGSKNLQYSNFTLQVPFQGIVNYQGN